MKLVLYEGVRYNEEKEQQAEWRAKVKDLERIEEAKKKAEKKSEFSFLSVHCILSVLVMNKRIYYMFCLHYLFCCIVFSIYYFI